MQIVMVPVGDLKPADYNPRQMTEKQAADLEASVREFGLVDPIIANSRKGRENIVVGGHQRLTIAKRLGMTEVPVVYVDLTPVKEKELNIRLNKNLGEWDFDALANNFDEELLRLTGFDDKDLDKILGAAEATEDDPPDLPTSSKTAVGDVYALGDHRVMCGDATVAADMAKLMDGKPAEMVFTDPPWNVVIGGASNPQHRQRPGLMNDKMTSGEFRNFLRLTSQAFAPHVTGDVYCIMGASEWPQLDAVLREEGFHWSATIIWVKESFVVGRSKYHRRYEPIWYGWKKDAKSSYRGDRAQDDVWEYPRPKKSEEHPTMKPVALCARAISNSAAGGGIVLDPFGGSGSTLAACQELGRVCRTMELDPRYVDVIVARWEKLTGQKAKKLL